MRAGLWIIIPIVIFSVVAGYCAEKNNSINMEKFNTFLDSDSLKVVYEENSGNESTERLLIFLRNRKESDQMFEKGEITKRIHASIINENAVRYDVYLFYNDAKQFVNLMIEDENNHIFQQTYIKDGNFDNFIKKDRQEF